MAHAQTNRSPGVRRGLATAIAVIASLAVLMLSGCAYQTAATSTSSASGVAAAATQRPAAVVATPVPTATPTPKVTTAPKPVAVNQCAHNTAAQHVLVSVKAQHLWMCQHTRVVWTAAVTTGAVDLPYRDTPIGTFTIQGKYTDQTLTLDTGAQYQVKYWIPFQGPLYGFHDSPWQTFPYGSQKYRTEGSHGCVHLALKTIQFLYGWARIGTPVTITA